jgi:hypothetical protein
MGRFLSLAIVMSILSGCVPIAHDPVRDEFGVSTARPGNGAASASTVDVAGLDAKAGQICARGYDRTHEDVEPAEADQQIVDMKLRCHHYDRLNFDFSQTDWSNLF